MKLFKASIDIFAIHSAIYPMNNRIFKVMECGVAIIPVFQHSIIPIVSEVN